MTSFPPKRGKATIQDALYWINERETIRVKREELKEPAPWTTDPILQRNAFLNVIREDDAGTRTLRRIVRSNPNVDPFMLMLWYRAFNLADHEQIFTRWDGDTDSLYRALDRQRINGNKVFTSAYMIYAGGPGGKGQDKLRMVFDRYEEVDIDRLGSRVVRGDSLQSVWEAMAPHIGPFNAYEVTLDIRAFCSSYPWFDKHTWAHFGPGAKRGLQWLGEETSLDGLLRIHELLRGQFLSGSMHALLPARLRLYGYDGWELEHTENVMCELSKYMRARHYGKGTKSRRNYA